MNLNKLIEMVSEAMMPVYAERATVPSYLVKYVVYAKKYDGGCTGNNGVELRLTYAGIILGKNQNGCHILARWVMQQPQWKGRRSQANVASEIKCHCQAYDNTWSRAIYGEHRLNPINIEYSRWWITERRGLRVD